MTTRASTKGGATRELPGQLPTGMSWAELVDWAAGDAGSLAAAARRVAAARGYKEDAASIERALRRLRGRGHSDGGAWGDRVLSTFGVPPQAEERARFLGAYHSRFTDLPLPLCRDLVAVWDRPPLSDAPSCATWLALARASCALRGREDADVATQLERARAGLSAGPPEARVEHALVEAYARTPTSPERAREQLDVAEGELRAAGVLDARAAPSADWACLHVRWTDQRAYACNRLRPPRYDESEALYDAVPLRGAPPFVASRRAGGLAYVAWKRGRRDQAVAFAREATTRAGDGGHLRLRAMSLSMLGRILGGDEGHSYRMRAIDIARRLDDESLRLRFERPAPSL